MVGEVESGPVRVERRDGVAIDQANRAIRALAPEHGAHGVDFVYEAVSDHLKARCYCGADLTFSGMQLAAAARQRVR